MPKQRTGKKLTRLDSSITRLVKIGELARLFSVLPSTINFYTREGLLPEDGRSQGGYRLYNVEKAMSRLRKIEHLQNKKRFTIEEIKKML
ncbi:hypothetical protein C0580_00730 [Candidatus Parcubacteria bacterium]|nr:MAG: hypothetical protein C0580_00730 [Candidatus Parcubacteria bacterium]